MTNPYYVEPMGGYGPGIAQGLAGLGKGLGEQQRAQEAAQKKQFMQQEIAQAYQSGDPNQVAQVMFKYPEMSKTVSEAIGFRNEATKNNMITSARSILSNPERTEEILNSRIAMVEAAGGDASDTREALEEYRTDPEGFLKNTQMTYASLDPEGFKEYQGAGAVKPTSNIQDFREWQSMPEGPEKEAFGKLIGVNESELAAERVRLQRENLALQRSEQQRQEGKLSAGLEKALLTAQDEVVNAQRSSNSFDVLANEFETRSAELAGGAKMTLTEFLKRSLGTQDDITEFRRRFNKVRLSEGLKNLPPGPATDRDVQEAFKGVPPENASPQQVASFLRGAARLARLDAAYNQFKADFISGNRSAAGLNKEWRKSFESPNLGRKVSNVEIYETAQNRGITPEEVKEKLGIQ